ncbi:MAG: glycine cleavage system aminomethyltransferase GcvT [Planctomycetaceae bacterium]
MEPQIQRTPLHQQHVELGAKMVPFAGWEMPVQYSGIIPEHNAVRQNVGVFDISHMGQFLVQGLADGGGQPACEWLNQLLTNDVSVLQPGQGQYTMLLNETAGIIDDLIVYRRKGDEYFLVVNAAKTAEDFDWMNARIGDHSLSFTNHSADYAAMAVQGPHSEAVFQKLFAGAIELPKRFCMTEIATEPGTVIVCRTGYTGEDGFELFCPVVSGESWWQKCLSAGATPAGLGARDTLRLEKCYPLNGNDLSPEHTPLEAGLGFAVDLKKSDFIGRDRLVKQRADGVTQKLVAIRQVEKSPPTRHGYKVFADNTELGELTSGGMSPTLGCGIGMAYLPVQYAAPGTSLEVEIRGKRYAAEVVRKPFVPAPLNSM